MQYAILIYENQAEFDARTGPAAPAYWAGWQAYTDALTRAGVMTGGHGLNPPAAATTVRVTGGKRQVHDGPFADTKEQLGGLYVIDVPDLDAALEWAARCPALPHGAVEVRPLMTMPN
jgi:hypothetical protein